MELRVFISCGEDRDRFRNAGVRVVDRLRHFLVNELGTGPILLNWDYRNDLPRDVPAGEFARRSLEMVDRSQILVGVLGPSVPPITRKEILRGYERQAGGEMMSPYLLADPALTDLPHTRLLRKVRRDFRRDVQFGHYHTQEELIHQMYGTLFRYLLEHGAAPPPSAPGPIA